MKIVSLVIRIDGKPEYVFNAIKELAKTTPDKTIKELYLELKRN